MHANTTCIRKFFSFYDIQLLGLLLSNREITKRKMENHHLTELSAADPNGTTHSSGRLRVLLFPFSTISALVLGQFHDVVLNEILRLDVMIVLKQ